MTSPRIAVLEPYGTVQTFMDNNVPDAMHYYDDTLHTYLKGSTYTYEFKTLTQHKDVQYLVEGNKLSFFFNDTGYYLTIMTVERGGIETTITAYGLCLELNNEEVDEYTGSSMSFTDYINAFGFEKSFDIGVNEVSDKSISCDWTGSSTILARLYSLATNFSAELEFVTELNSDYTLKGVTLNVYREHDDNHQGIGEDKTSQVLRYPSDIHSITKTSDITELVTGIRPTGKDGLQISSLAGRSVYDDNGKLLYYVLGNNIVAPQARDRFPSSILASNMEDHYTIKIWDYDTDSVETLYGQSLAELKKYCDPEVTYTVDAYIDGNIGDSYTIEDTEYNPTLYLTARITEQQISFTNPSNSSTTFDNFEETQAKTNSELLQEMQALIEKNKQLDCIISSTNGILFKADDDTTQLTATVVDGGVDVADNYQIQWYKDGTELSTDKTITVNASDVESKAVYSFKVFTGETLKGQTEVTVMKLESGTNAYLHVAYANSADGLLDFSLTDSDRKYLGQYSDSSTVNSTDPSKYRWSAIKGEDAQSLIDYVLQYYISTSNTAPTGGEWKEGNIDYVSDTYLWKRYKATYENPSETKYTEPYLDASWNTIDRKVIEISKQAENAETTANTANTNASSAKELATSANTNASSAVSKASEAQSSVDSANAEIKKINTEITSVQTSIDNAVADVNTNAKDIASIKETYATKTELTNESTSIKADVSTEITKQVGALETKVSETYEAKSDAVTMKGELQTQITQNANNISSHASEISSLQADTSQAQKDIQSAMTKATEAETLANTAKENAAKAQTDVDTAKANLATAQSELDTAKANLATVTGRVDATEKDIADAQSAVETAQKNIEQAQADVKSATTKAENAQATADTAKTNAQTAQDAVNALTSRVTTAETNIIQNANSITTQAKSISEVSTVANSANSKVDNLEIGGRNLLLNSSLHENYDKWETAIGNGYTCEFVTKENYQCLHIHSSVLTQTTYFSQPMLKKLSANTEYTMSGWYWTENIVKGTTNYTIMNCYADGNYKKDGTSHWFGVKASNMNINTGGWIYFTNTFITPTSDILDNAKWFSVMFYARDFTGDIYIRDLKLEKGNKATDWTPAPEDTQADIDDVKQVADTANTNASSAKETADKVEQGLATADQEIQNLSSELTQAQTVLQTQIEQKADAIVSEVSSTYAKFDDVNRVEEKLNTTIDQTKDSITTTVNQSVSTLQSQVDSVKTTTDSISNYMKFDSDGLELGKSDSAIKTKIDNESWAIVDSGVEVVKVTNQNLTITNGIFLKEIHVGNFAFVPRANGSLDFKKVGD